MTFISNYLEHPLFLEAWAELGREAMKEHTYDKYLFSYHGLPERQIRKGSVDGHCQLGSCCAAYGIKNQFCYRAQCFQTTRLIAEKLGLPEEKVLTCFQSRLGKDPWIKPYTEDTIKELAKERVKKVLVFSPAFVAIFVLRISKIVFLIVQILFQSPPFLRCYLDLHQFTHLHCFCRTAYTLHSRGLGYFQYRRRIFDYP